MFTGVGVALVTFFDDDGRVDPHATAEHAARLVERGVRGVVLAGTTGEADRLSSDDRVALLRAAREAVGETAALVVGTGRPDVGEAVAMSRAAVDAGADAVLVLSRPGDDDPRAYYGAVAAAVRAEAPLFAYHYPAVSPPGIPVEALADLPVDGLKDSSGDAERLVAELQVLRAGPPGAARSLYVGSSAYLSLAGPLGATGAILGLANTHPELCVRAFEGDHDAQRELLPHHRAMAEDFPHGLKRRALEAAPA